MVPQKRLSASKGNKFVTERTTLNPINDTVYFMWKDMTKHYAVMCFSALCDNKYFDCRV